MAAYDPGKSRGGWALAAAALFACVVVAACGVSETEGNGSQTASRSTGGGGGAAPDLTPPTTPTSLTASAVAPTRVDLAWSSSTDDLGVAGYRIFRGGVLLTTVGSVTTYQDTSAVASTTYSYTVQAIDAAANASGQSPASIVTTPAALDVSAPSAPTGLVATTVSLSQINLSWTASTDNVAVTAYRIIRNGFPLVDAPGNVTTYENRGLTASTTYVYTVRALDAAGNASGLSNAASATTSAAPDTVPPTAPSTLDANAVSSTRVNLSWSPATDNVVVANYRVYRDGVFLLSVAGTTYQDTGLTPSTSYSYNVDAVDGDGNTSGLSPSANVTTPPLPDTIAPAAPTNLIATAVSSSRIDLSWSASTDNVGVTGYRVFRNSVLIDTIGNVTTYQNTGLSAGTTYSYRVRALDAAGNVSAQSALASATTQPAPDTIAPTTPTGLGATTASASQINLSWNASTDNVAVTGYRIYRNNTFLITVGVVTAFSDLGLSASTTYSYNVDAVDAVGNASGLSASASATTQASGGTPGTPSIGTVSGTISHGSSITISGSSFGTKSHAGPMLWDDFDSGSNGSAVAAGTGAGTEPLIHQGNLAAYSQWERGGVAPSNQSVVFNNASPKANSSLHARANFSSNSYWSLNLIVPYNQFTTGNELYISFYYRVTMTGSGFPRQTKAWMAYDASTDAAYWANSYGICQAGDYWRTHRTQSPDEKAVSPGLSATGIDGEWVRFESYLKQSGAGVANGAWHQVVYRPSLGTPSKHVATLDSYKMRDSSSNWTDWTFGGAYYSMCSSSNTATIDVDDFYMDSTPARLEVCNAPTYSASTKCELQIPITWSDTAITATLKRGYLSAGTAYVYVFNGSGNVNAAGHPVTIVP